MVSICVRVATLCLFFFFFQAEDGIRDLTVTGVQTCALPIFIKTAVSAIEKAYDFESAVSDKQRLEKLASTDALTGCMNRRALADALAGELDRARRYNLALTIMLADLDRFKSINDTRGHIAGDSVLRQVGELL